MDWLSFNSVARELVAWMADASERAAVLGILALLLVLFARRSSTVQHMAWTLVLAGMLALLFVRPVVPATHVHLPRVLTSRPSAIAPVRLNANPTRTPAPKPKSETMPTPLHPPFWPLFVIAAYLAGVLLFGARLLAGASLTSRALRNTRTIHEELWEYYDLIADTNVDLNLEESDSVRVPLTTGSKLMRVIFPADWREWPAEKRKAVLAHELAHARRRDSLIALVVVVNKCLFWFHPLAWWLERRLPVLAEHAADDAALAVSPDSQAYARLLLENAARLDYAGNRLIWHSAAMSGPVVAERIRRVLDVRTVERLKPLGIAGRAMLLCLGATLIWISTAVDVPRLIAGQANNRFPWMVTAEQATTLEQELAANPEDEATRGKLLRYYLFSKMCADAGERAIRKTPECSDLGGQQAYERRIPLILWLIDHHPESELLGDPSTGISPQLDGPNVYEDARNRWLTQVSLHPNDARVLANAARYGSPQEQLDLLRRARKLDPERRTEPLARLYSLMLLWVNETGTLTDYKDPGLAAQIRNELQSSNDIALVGSVARHVVEEAAGKAVGHASAWDFNALRILATELVTHAQTLEPANRAWSDLMEGVRALPLGSLPSVEPVAAQTNRVQTDRVQTLRLSGAVAAANLQESSPPIYPPEFKAAGLRLEGTVKLQIRIGTDGHVRETTAISGDQALVNAAMDAAMRYVYKPTLLNGQPAEVQTDVEIVFRQPEP
jgi:beta-lactamase regulating signal transducer with metallopeptidase domain